MVSGFPVVISERGTPFVAVESGAPLATVAANGLGIPIRIVESGAPPLVVQGLEPEPSPSFVSATAIPDGGAGADTFTPFTALDLTNCDLALVWVFTTDNITLATASTGWAKLGQANIPSNPIGGTNGRFALFWKAEPGAAEEFVVTGGSGGTARWGAILERVAAADTVTWTTNSASTFDTAPNPPPHDAGAVRPTLWTAGVACAALDVTAAPSGYGNLTIQPGQGGTTYSAAIATLASEEQSQDPGAFTTAAATRRATATAACYAA
jgi:hypothetical protein